MAHRFQKVYFHHCDCGERLELNGGKAGAEIECNACGAEIEIESFRQMTADGFVLKSIRSRPFQFGISALVRAVLPFAAICWAGTHFGWEIVLIALAIPIFFVAAVMTTAICIHHGPLLIGKFWDWMGVSENRME